MDEITQVQLIEIEKQNFLNQDKDRTKELIGDFIGGNKKKTDSAKQDNAIRDVLGDILGGSKKEDSTKTSTTENTVKNVLSGLLKNKKETRHN